MKYKKIINLFCFAPVDTARFELANCICLKERIKKEIDRRNIMHYYFEYQML